MCSRSPHASQRSTTGGASGSLATAASAALAAASAALAAASAASPIAKTSWSARSTTALASASASSSPTSGFEKPRSERAASSTPWTGSVERLGGVAAAPLVTSLSGVRVEDVTAAREPDAPPSIGGSAEGVAGGSVGALSTAGAASCVPLSAATAADGSLTPSSRRTTALLPSPAAAARSAARTRGPRGSSSAI